MDVRYRTELLNNSAARGLDPTRKRLFGIDDSKALRAAIDEVFGKANPVQPCREHKLSSVMDHLPDDLKDQIKGVMQAAGRMEPEAGKKQIC